MGVRQGGRAGGTHGDALTSPEKAPENTSLVLASYRSSQANLTDLRGFGDAAPVPSILLHECKVVPRTEGDTQTCSSPGFENDQ